MELSELLITTEINLMKKLFLFFVLISFVLLNFGCKKNPTEPEKPIPPTPPSLELSIDGVSCTEAWIKVKKLNDTTFLPISVKINDKEFFRGFLEAVDTVLFVDSLTPNTTYTVKGIVFDTVKEITITTLPTTSHNFTWQTFTFGERTSTLYDVAIIDENNIWAVGEIYMNDSLGNSDTQRYNALHWDGNRWGIKRVPYNYEGTNYYHPIHAVFAFGTNDVWFCGNGVIHWNGSNFMPISISTNIWGPYQMNKIWGTSGNDLFVVGNGGNIAHYNGTSWIKIESGTTTDLTDVYGDGDNVFICGYKDFKPTVLLKYNNGILTKLIEEDHFEYKTDFISGWIKSIWVKKDKLFSLTFYDLYRSKTSTKGEGTAIWKGDINSWGSNAVRGNDVNDIFTTGYNGLLWHFNGVGWKRYDELGETTNHYRCISVTDKLIVIAGFKYLNGIDRYGLITIGRRK